MATRVVTRTYDRVEVEWFDAISCDDWKEGIEPTVTIPQCFSTGYLWKLDEKEVVLVSTITACGGYTGDFAIPRGCAKRIKKLGKKTFKIKVCEVPVGLAGREV